MASLTTRVVKFCTGILILAAVARIIVMRGAEREAAAIDAAPSTHWLYTDEDRVCGRNDETEDEEPSFTTLASVVEAQERERDVAHCGSCGRCSTMRDMTILARTTSTLTETARSCGARGYLASVFLWRGIDVYRRVGQDCMREEVGFTEPCLECWLDDMVCGIQQCIFTCLKSEFVDRDPNNHDDGRLNRCYECDERLCGPEFMTCSGTNRRRQGIRSDLGRNEDTELCLSVDMAWNVMVEAGREDSIAAKNSEL